MRHLKLRSLAKKSFSPRCVNEFFLKWWVTCRSFGLCHHFLSSASPRILSGETLCSAFLPLFFLLHPPPAHSVLKRLWYLVRGPFSAKDFHRLAGAYPSLCSRPDWRENAFPACIQRRLLHCVIYLGGRGNAGLFATAGVGRQIRRTEKGDREGMCAPLPNKHFPRYEQRARHQPGTE